MRPTRRNGKGEREKRKESRKTKGNAAAASSRNTGDVSGRATGGWVRAKERKRERGGANAAEFVRGQGDTRFTLRGNSGVYSRARVNPGTRYRRIEAGRRRREAGGDKSARGEWRSEIARRFGANDGIYDNLSRRSSIADY